MAVLRDLCLWGWLKRTYVRYCGSVTVAVNSVSVLAERVRPVALARERVLPVAEPLAGLLPDRGLVRGSTVEVGGAAARSLALAVAVEAVQQGSWVASVGLASLGLAAAERLGLPLERLVVVPDLEQNQWPCKFQHRQCGCS